MGWYSLLRGVRIREAWPLSCEKIAGRHGLPTTSALEVPPMKLCRVMYPASLTSSAATTVKKNNNLKKATRTEPPKLESQLLEPKIYWRNYCVQDANARRELSLPGLLETESLR